MRRLITSIDQAPGWQFVLGALLLLAAVKASWMIGQLGRNPGATELGGLLLLAGSIGFTIFAIRRRQTGVWDAAAQVIITIAGANLLAYGLLVPFLPDGAGGEVVRLVRAGLGETLVSVGFAIPVQAGGLWLSRRFGSHSAVTERRMRVVNAKKGLVLAAAADAGGRDDEPPVLADPAPAPKP